jgi:hypothetical protein
MHSVLFTLADRDYVRIGNDFTFSLMKEYASKFGLDFVNADKFDHDRPYSWQAMEMWHDLLDEYDRLLMVSVDAIIAPDAINVLDFPVGTFYGIDEYPFDDAPLNEGYCKKIWEHARAEWSDEFDESEDHPGFLYNTGLFLCDKSHQKLFAPVSKELNHGLQDMSALNMHLWKYGMRHLDLRPEVFNASHLWFNENQRPGVALHVMHQEPLSKYDGVKMYMKKMGYA